MSSMPRIRVETVIDAPPGLVWARLADIADHVHWMADAAEIRFAGDQRTGVGTTFDCDTRVGPLRTTDRMQVIEWVEGETIGVEHRGIVRGRGRFRLRPAPRERTRLIWDEQLRFPRWLGGALAATAASPVLRRIWQGNLRRFAARVTG
jgi:hypothetical protein